jgi:hypothetical protein
MSNRGLFTFLSLHKYTAMIIFIAFIAMTALGAWPTTVPQSPMWEVWVVDQFDHPLGNMIVDLSCQFAGSYATGEVLRTDQNGYVAFKPSVVRVPQILRIAAAVPLPYFHSTFGPQVWIWARGNGLEGIAMDDGHVAVWRGAPARQASKIVATPGEKVVRMY